jgi:hypothetical protein
MPFNDELRANLSVAIAKWEASSDEGEGRALIGVIEAAQALAKALLPEPPPAATEEGQ